MDSADQAHELSLNRVDALMTMAKAVAGAAPFIGPIVAEIIGQTIPNQRVDRITSFLRHHDQRVRHIERTRLDVLMQQLGNVDLLEDAFTQAARATSQERIKDLATVVANGISSEESQHAEAKRMLWLLSQLGDEEVIILRSKLPSTRGDYELDTDFQNRHEELLAPDATHLGSSDDELEEAALKSNYREHLRHLGLIRHRFKKPKRGELPEFDPKTGMMKAGGSNVTQLGEMLLRYLGLMPDWKMTN